MRWEDERESSNVEDARGFSIGGRGAGIGCGGLVIILLVSWLTGINPLQLLNIVQSASPTTSQAPSAPSQGNPAGPARPGQPPSRARLPRRSEIFRLRTPGDTAPDSISMRDWLRCPVSWLTNS